MTVVCPILAYGKPTEPLRAKKGDWKAITWLKSTSGSFRNGFWPARVGACTREPLTSEPHGQPALGQAEKMKTTSQVEFPPSFMPSRWSLHSHT